VVVVVSYPIAAYIAFGVDRRRRNLWLLAVTIPFWTSYLLRVFAWKVILGYNGVINSSLLSLGIIYQPLEILLYNPFAVVLTLAHAWAPFALLPIYISLSRIDTSLIEASRDLGDSMLHVFRRVILPLSKPGLIAASLLIFIPTVGDYVTPQLVGGTSGLMIGNVVQSMFGRANNWPFGAAISVMTMITIASWPGLCGTSRDAMATHREARDEVQVAWRIFGALCHGALRADLLHGAVRL